MVDETFVYYFCFNNHKHESKSEDMKITKKALDKMNTQTGRLRLALSLGFSETWVRGLLDKNKDNGPLTTAAALKVIREVTGFSDEQILTDATQKVKAA